MKGQKKGTYNIMRNFIIKEIGAVPAGAMGPGSNMVIMKSVDEIEKKHALLDPMGGHSHTLSYISDDTKGESSPAGEGENYHSHPWINGMNGELIVGYANGHTHRVGFFSKTDPTPVADATNLQEDTTMNESEFQAQIDELKKSLEESKANADVYLAYGKMNDAEKAFHKNLTGDAQSEFVNADDKSEQIAKAEELANASDPVVATTEDGVEILKSQDPTGLLTEMVAKAKHAKEKSDKDEDEKKKFKFEAKKAELEKRAAGKDYENLPGTMEQKAEMLKAFDAIEDEGVREAAHAALVAKNTELESAFQEVGTVGSPDPITKSLTEQIDVLRDEILKSEPTLTKSAAYVKAIESKEGLILYDQLVNPQESV